MIPLCAANGISQIVWSPLGQGVLSGKYDPGPAAAEGFARRQRRDGRLHRPADAARGPARRAAAEADRRGGRADPAPIRARLGACASPMSPRRSSAPRGPAQVMRKLRARRAWSSIPNCSCAPKRSSTRQLGQSRDRPRSPPSCAAEGETKISSIGRSNNSAMRKASGSDGIVFAGLDRIDALARHFEPLGEVLLAPVALGAEHCGGGFPSAAAARRGRSLLTVPPSRAHTNADPIDERVAVGVVDARNCSRKPQTVAKLRAYRAGPQDLTDHQHPD